MELIISHLTKKYKELAAVNDVSMRLESPTIYGLVGKNGAGKTTLLKMIAGLARPTSGEITGVSAGRVGLLIEEPGLYSHLSARDNLIVRMKTLGMYSEKTADELIGRVGLAAAARKKAGTFSLGMKQRLGIALALVGDPDVILLDEPINGLDPEGVVLVRELLFELRRAGKIIIVSSHILEELSKISDRYGILDRGVLVRELDAAEAEEMGGDTYAILVDDAGRTADILSRIGANFTANGQHFTICGGEDRAIPAVAALFENGVRVREFKRSGNALENILLDKGGSVK